MVRVGGLLGALLGFAVSVVFTEIIFANNQEWPIAINAALTVGGALAGSSLMRRFANRNAKPS